MTWRTFEESIKWGRNSSIKAFLGMVDDGEYDDDDDDSVIKNNNIIKSFHATSRGVLQCNWTSTQNCVTFHQPCNTQAGLEMGAKECGLGLARPINIALEVISSAWNP